MRFYKRKPKLALTFPLGPSHHVLGALTIKHIPKPARAACAINLEGILRKIASKPSEPSSWHLLLSFAQNILRAPKRGGRERNLASKIIKRTDSSSVDDEESVRTASSSDKRDAVTSKLAAVSAKLEDGNISAAVSILCSDEVIVDYSSETLAKLQLKHSGEHESISSPPERSPSTALQVGEEDVLRAISSFLAGSSGGPMA